MTDSSVEAVARAIMEAQPYNLSPDEAMNCARAVLALPSPEREPMREALDEARFLCERLCDFESELDSDEVASEFYGHVAPSLARLQAMLAPPPAQSGDRT